MSQDFSGLIGLELKGTTFKVKKKKLIEFAKSIGAKQPEFLDENDPIAHPAYANAYVFPALMKINDAKLPDGSALIKNPLKILHGGQGYSFPKGAPPVKDGDKIRTIPKIKNIEIKASNKMMLITVEATSKIDKSKDESKVGKTVCVSEIGIVVMPGGY
ncbi:MAG: FAS1-like dehydratase domain-containing protein [Candidatus Helarchaeota archaeon]